MGLTNRPILESLKKATILTILTLGIKPLVSLAKGSLKLWKPLRQLDVLQDIPSYDILKDLEVV
jgi:hypothetical protein